MNQPLHLHAKILESQFGKRLDQALTELFPYYSRSRIQAWILGDKVQVNSKIINKPKKKVCGSEIITVNVLLTNHTPWQPQKIFLNIIYEDDEILIINKPCNLVVHPGAGNPDKTILNALLYRYPKIIHVPRTGIIHRLDKNTTGLMVIAKTIPAQDYLVKSMKLKKITREYEAIVQGHMIMSGKVHAPIARNHTNRTHMSVNPMGRTAITHYKIIERFRYHTRLRLQLESGRTHQIRVHMKHIKHPLIGDPVYGNRKYLLKGVSEAYRKIINNFNRQALHAKMLRLYHPRTGFEMEWHADIPADMAILINILKEDAVMHQNTIN